MAQVLKYSKSFPETGSILACELHGYYSGCASAPTHGCARCWKVYFLYKLSRCPKHRQEEFLSKLERFSSLLVGLKKIGIEWHPGMKIEDITFVPDGEPIRLPERAEPLEVQ